MKKIISFFVLFITISGTLLMTASAYWSDSYKISFMAMVSTYTMDHGIPGVPKITSDAYAEFQGGYITSWSRPSARLVNSEKESRSAWAERWAYLSDYTGDGSKKSLLLRRGERGMESTISRFDAF